jgi:hypothetical protein
VIIKTIQSLHGCSRAKPERRGALVRELAAAASREFTGYAEVCVIAPQKKLVSNIRKSRHPSAHSRAIQSDRRWIGHARPAIAVDFHEVSLQRHSIAARQACKKA